VRAQRGDGGRSARVAGGADGGQPAAAPCLRLPPLAARALRAPAAPRSDLGLSFFLLSFISYNSVIAQMVCKRNKTLTIQMEGALFDRPVWICDAV
jgi:hypothetical protein